MTMRDDDYAAELARQRADARLRMYERLLVSLSARVAYLHQCVEAAGMTMEQFRELPWGEGREAVIRRGRKALERGGTAP